MSTALIAEQRARVVRALHADERGPTISKAKSQIAAQRAHVVRALHEDKSGTTISKDELDTVVRLVTNSTTGGMARTRRKMTDADRVRLAAVLQRVEEVVQRGKCFGFVAKVVGWVLSEEELPTHSVLSTLLTNAAGGFNDPHDALTAAEDGHAAGVRAKALQLAEAARTQATEEHAAATCAVTSQRLAATVAAAEAAAAAAPATAAAKAFVAAMAAVPLAIAATADVPRYAAAVKAARAKDAKDAADTAVADLDNAMKDPKVGDAGVLKAAAKASGAEQQKIETQRAAAKAAAKAEPRHVYVSPRKSRSEKQQRRTPAGTPTKLRAAASPSGRSPPLKKGKGQKGSAEKAKQPASDQHLAHALSVFLEEEAAFPAFPMTAEAVAALEAAVLVATPVKPGIGVFLEADEEAEAEAGQAFRWRRQPQQQQQEESLRDTIGEMGFAPQDADAALTVLSESESDDSSDSGSELRRPRKLDFFEDFAPDLAAESGEEAAAAAQEAAYATVAQTVAQAAEEHAEAVARAAADLAAESEEEGEEEEQEEAAAQEQGGGGAAAPAQGGGGGGARAAAAAMAVAAGRGAETARRAALHAALYMAFLERLPDAAAAMVAAYCSARQGPALHVLVARVLAAGRAAAPFGDSFPNAPISGELTPASLVVLMAICHVHCGATPASLFCDAGSGKGMALLAAALLLGCPTCGIEVHPLRVKISVGCISAGWAKLAALVGGAALPPATRFYLSRADLAACATLGAGGVGATIVYCFDTGMPYDVVLAIARAINATATVTWMLSFQNMVAAGLHAEEVTSLATTVSMHGSGSGKTCRFFRMQQPRVGPTAAARANDDSFTLDGAGRVAQVSGVDLTTHGW